MGYYDQQFMRLGDGGRFAVKIQARDDNTTDETHWMNANADQVGRIMEILRENDTAYEISNEDVGKTHIHAFGKSWPVVDFIGQILVGDVGKRVFKVPTNDGASLILHVESDRQRDRRTNK